MTTLKLAHMYAALSRPDGKVPAPRMAIEAGTPADTFHFDLSRRDVWYLEAGMRRVTGPGGTAALSRLRDWEFIGKTGTAQNPHGKDHAWFVGTGGQRGGEAEIAVTMFLEHAEHGYVASGYVAEAINFYLNHKYGRPQPSEGWGTPRLRLAHNLPVDWNWATPIQDPPLPTISNANEKPAKPAAVRH
jgi:penicillin-binding protein 2